MEHSGKPASFRPGDIVKLSQPAPGEESARYVVSEWNEDRGFVRLVCTLPIAPVELVRASEIELVDHAK